MQSGWSVRCFFSFNWNSSSIDVPLLLIFFTSPLILTGAFHFSTSHILVLQERNLQASQLPTFAVHLQACCFLRYDFFFFPLLFSELDSYKFCLIKMVEVNKNAKNVAFCLMCIVPIRLGATRPLHCNKHGEPQVQTSISILRCLIRDPTKKYQIKK